MFLKDKMHYDEKVRKIAEESWDYFSDEKNRELLSDVL